MFGSTKSSRLHQNPSIDLETSPAVPAVPTEERVSLAAIVSALSFALDLTEGAVPGHALRTCVLGMNIGKAIGLEPDEFSDLYYALLLKDVGCSSNSARMSEILGADERRAKAAIKTVDWTDSLLACGLWAARQVLPGAGPLNKIRRLAWMSQHGEENNLAMFRARCERGASIALKIGVSQRCARAIYTLDEHWNGEGFPDHLKQAQIPLLARILLLAQHLDVFATAFGPRQAVASMEHRKGTWFDPDLVRIASLLARDGTLWQGHEEGQYASRVIELEPGFTRGVDPLQLDRICESFAEVVDAKSPMTYQHSVGVTHAAAAISGCLRLPPERRQVIHRAALLHDIGKLSVPNTILDSPNSLTPEQWVIVRRHPIYSYQILARVPTFGDIAVIAGRHHERLDGSGYPLGLTADELTLDDRIVAAADVYSTLSEERPYRARVPHTQIRSILGRLHQDRKLDPLCCEALIATLGQEPNPSEELCPEPDMAPFCAHAAMT